MFYQKLESLRGIAALTIALGHSLIVLSVDGIDNIWEIGISDLSGIQSITIHSMLTLLGRGATITTFFVLSGYVLGLSLDRSKVSVTNCLSFCIKRVFRIYPAHIVCLGIVLVTIPFFHTYHTFESSSQWYKWWYHSDITLNVIMGNIFLNDVNLNPVTWTLQVEIIMSLLLPVAHWFSRKLNLTLNIVMLLVLMCLSYLNTNILLVYAFVFYAALITPLIMSNMKLFIAGKYRSILFLFCLLVLFLSRLLFEGSNQFYYIFAECMTSLYIVVYLSQETKNGFVEKIFGSELLKTLGKISYSFYLSHFIILYWISYVMFLLVDSVLLKEIPLIFEILLAAVSVIITFYISKCIYTFVEKPMIGFGNSTTAKFFR